MLTGVQEPGISATAKTDLVFIEGNLNGKRYIDEVLTPHVLPFLCQIIIIIITSLFIEDYILSTCKYLSNIWSS